MVPLMPRRLNLALAWLAVPVVLSLLAYPLSAPAQEVLFNKLNQSAMRLYRQGKYREGVKVAKEALKVGEETFGYDHPSVGTSLNNLAALYYTLGRYALAEPLYKRGLAIDEKTLGPDHPSVANSLENYAALLRNTNRESEAAKMEARAKRIRAGQ